MTLPALQRQRSDLCRQSWSRQSLGLWLQCNHLLLPQEKAGLKNQENVRNAIGGKFPLYSLGFGSNLNYNFLENIARRRPWACPAFVMRFRCQLAIVPCLTYLREWKLTTSSKLFHYVTSSVDERTSSRVEILSLVTSYPSVQVLILSAGCTEQMCFLRRTTVSDTRPPVK